MAEDKSSAVLWFSLLLFEGDSRIIDDDVMHRNEKHKQTSVEECFVCVNVELDSSSY